MTREEAIELNKETCCHMSDELIHAIYNSFESRTCESCRAYKHDRRKELMKCSKLGLRFHKSFYCKAWEAKDD